MADQTIEELEALGLGSEPEQTEQPEVEQEQQEEQQEEALDLSAKEQIAYDQGWRPEDQFTGKEGNWKTAGEYIMYGEHQEQLREMKVDQRRRDTDFDSRIAGLNKLHVAQTDAKIKSLKEAQREAVNDMDVEKFDKLEAEIDKEKAQQPTEAAPAQTDTRPQELVDWETKNAYIFDQNSKKANDAQFFFKQAWEKPELRDSYKAQLAFVDSQMDALYPAETPTNPRRNMPTNTEQSVKTTPRGGKSRAITMNDLTSDEKTQWHQFSEAGIFSNEKDFLKAVTDARKG